MKTIATRGRRILSAMLTGVLALSLSALLPSAAEADVPASVNIKLSDTDVAGMSDKSYWWSEGNGSRSLVKFVEQAGTLSFTYKVTDATAPNAPVAGATVTLDATSPSTNSSFTGLLSGTTDANGEVTFTLTNTNTAAEPRPVAPSSMTNWDDSRTVSPEYKFDIIPSVTGATSTNRDRIWTHIVETAAPEVPASVNIKLSDSDVAAMSDKSYWWSEGNGSRSLVKFVSQGGVLNFTYKVTDATAPNAAVAGATVTLDATSPTTNSSFSGSLTGTTDANGEVTFTLTNTNSAAEPRPVAPSSMTNWDDSRSVSPEYKFDIVPSVTGATSANRDRIWTHVVEPLPVNIKLLDADVAKMTDKSAWWSEGNGSRSLVKFVEKGGVFSFTYKVTETAEGNAPVVGATVNLDASSPTTNSSFTGSLTGTTDANGEVTFTLTNTNTDTEPRPVAPSTMDYWDDSRSVSPEYKFDIVPSVVGGTAANRDRIWTHVVAKSSNAALSGLSVASNFITQSFDVASTTHSLNVSNIITALNVTAEAQDAGAAITVNGVPVVDEAAVPVTLTVGANLITVVVTAADGVTTATHSITITRAPAVISPITVTATGGKGVIKVVLTGIAGKTIYITRQNGSDSLKLTRIGANVSRTIYMHPRTKGLFKVNVRVGIKNVTLTVRVW